MSATISQLLLFSWFFMLFHFILFSAFSFFAPSTKCSRSRLSVMLRATWRRVAAAAAEEKVYWEILRQLSATLAPRRHLRSLHGFSFFMSFCCFVTTSCQPPWIRAQQTFLFFLFRTMCVCVCVFVVARSASRFAHDVLNSAAAVASLRGRRRMTV